MATSESYKDFVLEQLARCDSEYLANRFAFCARKMFGEYCVYIRDSAFSDFWGSASSRSLQRTASASHSPLSHNPENSSKILESQQVGIDSSDLPKKVLFLLCDEQVFVKKYEALGEIVRESSEFFALGFPFSGAKEHYIIDIENLALVAKIIKSILPFLPVPKASKHIKTLTKANKAQKQTRKHKNIKAESKQNPKK